MSQQSNLKCQPSTLPKTESSPIETLQAQFSGYGSTPSLLALTLSRLSSSSSSSSSSTSTQHPLGPLESWDEATISAVVSAFVDDKFPTVLALNKIDHADADKNIAKIAKGRDPQTMVLTSAISEVFLRRLAKQGYVRYVEGSEVVETREDLVEEGDEEGGGLRELDEKLKT
ncbi:MAG: hypothetical protein Q9165_001551 [Trypethelium subeluteriae]